MEKIGNCPKCKSEYTYQDGEFYMCAQCAHTRNDKEDIKEESEILDANGNVLKDGDAVIVIKGLKVKGSSNPIK